MIFLASDICPLVGGAGSEAKTSFLEGRAGAQGILGLVGEAGPSGVQGLVQRQLWAQRV